MTRLLLATKITRLNLSLILTLKESVSITKPGFKSELIVITAGLTF